MADIVTVVIGNVLRAGGSVLVVDDLNSTSSTAALSANQGNILAQQIADINPGGGAVQSVAGKTGVVTLTKSDVSLANVDNTSDANKPVSTAQATAIALKEPVITPGSSSQYYRGDKTFQTLDKAAVGLSLVDNTADNAKPVSSLQQTALNAKEGTITAGTNGQYWRGDKTFQTLDKIAVGLANVDNTSDVSKPVSAATQTALNLKANTSSLATVATSGVYSDLTGKPTLSTVASTGAYSDLSGRPTLATVSATGAYSDLTGKPTIPAAQVNSDWNSVSGLSQITNKPTLATVATSGAYSDLSAKPQVVVQSTMPSDLTIYPDNTLFIIG